MLISTHCTVARRKLVPYAAIAPDFASALANHTRPHCTIPYPIILYPANHTRSHCTILYRIILYPCNHTRSHCTMLYRIILFPANLTIPYNQITGSLSGPRGISITFSGCRRCSDHRNWLRPSPCAMFILRIHENSVSFTKPPSQST